MPLNIQINPAANPGWVIIPDATTTTAGLMSAADKVKLNSLANTNGLLGAYQGASAAAQNVIGITAGGGPVTIQDNAVGQNQTIDLILENLTAATAGQANQKYSPMIQVLGHNFNGADQAIGVDLQVRPFTGVNNFSLDFYQDIAGTPTRLMGWFPQTPNQGSVGFATQSGQSFAIETATLANDGSVNGNGIFISTPSASSGKISMLLQGLQEFQFRSSANNDGAAPIGLVPRVTDSYWIGTASTANGGPFRLQGIFSDWYDTKFGLQLTLSANTYTPTSGKHHVVGGGATLLKTIATTNIPTNSTPSVTFVVDTSTLSWDATGNISVASSSAIPVGSSVTFDWDGTKWNPSRVS